MRIDRARVRESACPARRPTRIQEPRRRRVKRAHGNQLDTPPAPSEREKIALPRTGRFPNCVPARPHLAPHRALPPVPNLYSAAKRGEAAGTPHARGDRLAQKSALVNSADTPQHIMFYGIHPAARTAALPASCSDFTAFNRSLTSSFAPQAPFCSALRNGRKLRSRTLQTCRTLWPFSNMFHSRLISARNLTVIVRIRLHTMHALFSISRSLFHFSLLSHITARPRAPAAQPSPLLGTARSTHVLAHTV